MLEEPSGFREDGNELDARSTSLCRNELDRLYRRDGGTTCRGICCATLQMTGAAEHPCPRGLLIMQCMAQRRRDRLQYICPVLRSRDNYAIFNPLDNSVVLRKSRLCLPILHPGCGLEGRRNSFSAMLDVSLRSTTQATVCSGAHRVDVHAFWIANGRPQITLVRGRRPSPSPHRAPLFSPPALAVVIAQ